MSVKIINYKEIKSADSCRFDGMSLGEVMLRIDPYDVPTARARVFRVSQGGGETNVACGMAYTFGLRSAVLTALVDDNIGRNIQNQLREAGVDTTKIIWFSFFIFFNFLFCPININGYNKPGIAHSGNMLGRS